MIQITPQMRILVAVAPVDFRKGIDGLAALCRQALARDPLAGTLFVFCSRRRHALKCLIYDGQGFWLCQKRLSQGRFTAWPRGGPGATLALDPHQLHLLLWNGDPTQAHTAPLWRRVPVAESRLNRTSLFCGKRQRSTHLWLHSDPCQTWC